MEVKADLMMLNNRAIYDTAASSKSEAIEKKIIIIKNNLERIYTEYANYAYTVIQTELNYLPIYLWCIQN